MSRFSLRAAAFLLVATSASVSQTALDLTNRFGETDVEGFSVNPDIRLTAVYEADQSACEMKIEPKHSILKEPERGLGMAPEVVVKIVDELIPRSERGILLNNIIADMGGVEDRVFQYQNVTITHHFLHQLPAHHNEDSATIVRQDGLCGTSNPRRENGFVAIPLKALDLQMRYGDPDVQWFAVRPAVSLMVEYGSDRTACQMLLEPKGSILTSDKPAKYLRPELVTEILDEVIPESDRGAETSHSVTKSGCNEIDIAEYLRVTIVRFRHNCQLPDPETEGRATTTRKDAACQSLTK
jgi:hypothetical protein